MFMSFGLAGSFLFLENGSTSLDHDIMFLDVVMFVKIIDKECRTRRLHH